MKRLFTSAVATGLFVARTVVLGMMALCQLAVGGADVRPARPTKGADPRREKAAPKSR